MKVADIVEMNNHSKQAIYEAYSVEAAARKEMNYLLNEERRRVAMHCFDAQAWQDHWLEYIVMTDVEIVGDKRETLDEYFAHPRRGIVMTPAKGFYAFTNEGDHIFIWFAWTNPHEWRTEYRDMPRLIKDLAKRVVLPVRYTGVDNIMKNHSIEVAPNLFELKL